MDVTFSTVFYLLFIYYYCLYRVAQNERTNFKSLQLGNLVQYTQRIYFIVILFLNHH